MKKQIKNFLKKFFFTKRMFAAWENRRIAQSIGKKREILHANGDRLIKDIQTSLSMTGYPFFFDYGTLLGIIREGKILDHDLDLDVSTIVKDGETIKATRKALNDSGCVLKVVNMTKDGIIAQDTFEKYNIEFDVYYHYEIENRSCVYVLYRNPEISYNNNEWNIVSQESARIKKTILYPFKSYKVNVPENYEDHLVSRYGKKWKIPNKNYVYWKGATSIPVDKIGYMVFKKDNED